MLSATLLWAHQVSQTHALFVTNTMALSKQYHLAKSFTPECVDLLPLIGIFSLFE